MAFKLVFCRNLLPRRWRSAGAATAATAAAAARGHPSQPQQQQQKEGSANSKRGEILLSARLQLLQLTGNSISSPFHGGYYALLLLLAYTALLLGGAVGLPWLLLSCWATWGLRMLCFSCGGLSSVFDIVWVPAAVHAAQQRARQVCVRKELRGRLRKELRGLDIATFVGGEKSDSTSSSSERSTESPSSGAGSSSTTTNTSRAAAAAFRSALPERGRDCGGETVSQRNPADREAQGLGSGDGSEEEAAAIHDETATAVAIVGRSSLTARRRTSSRWREQQQHVPQEAPGSPSWGGSRSRSGGCCCTEVSKAATAAADQQQQQGFAEWQEKSPPPRPASVKEELQQANVLRQQRAAAAAAAAAAANAQRLLGLTSLEDSRRRAGKAALTEEDIDYLLRKAHVELELAVVFADAAAAGRHRSSLGDEAVAMHRCCVLGKKADAPAAVSSFRRAAAPPAATPSTACAAGDVTTGGPTVATAAAAVATTRAAAAARGEGGEGCSGKRQRISSGKRGAAEACFSGTGVTSAVSAPQGDDRVRAGGAPGDRLQLGGHVSNPSIHDKGGGSNSSNQAGAEGREEGIGGRSSNSEAGGSNSSSEAGGGGEDRGGRYCSSEAYEGGGRTNSSEAGGRSSSSEAGGSNSSSEAGGGGKDRGGRYCSSEAYEGGGRTNSSEAGGRSSSSEGGEDGTGSGGGEGSVDGADRREENRCWRCLIPWKLIFRGFLAHCECTYLVDLLFCHAELSPLSSSIRREVLLLLHCLIRGMTVFLVFASPYCYVPYSHGLRTRQLLSTLCICICASFGAVACLLLTPLFVENLLQPLLRLLLLPGAVMRSDSLLLLLTDARLAVPSLPVSHEGSTWNTRAGFYAISQLLTLAVVSVGAYAAVVRLHDAEPRVAAAARRDYATDLLALLALEKKKQQQTAGVDDKSRNAAASTGAAQRREFLSASEVRKCRGEGQSRCQSVGAASSTEEGRDKGVTAHTGAAGRRLTSAGEGSKISVGEKKKCVDDRSPARHHDNNKGFLTSSKRDESGVNSKERPQQKAMLQSTGLNIESLTPGAPRPEEEPMQRQQQRQQQSEEREQQEKEEAAFDVDDGRLSLLLAEKVVEVRHLLDASDFELLRGRVVRRLVQAGGGVAACCLLLCWTAVALLAVSNVAMRVNTASDIFKEQENVRLMSAAAAAASLLDERTAGGFEDWAEDLRLLQEEMRDLMNYYARIQRHQGWTAVAAELWEQLGEEFSAAREERDTQGKQEMNAYAVLGVKPTATGTDIKKAYKLLAKQLHPDLLAAAASHKAASPEELDAATERMRKINAAYEKLMRKHGGRGGRSS